MINNLSNDQMTKKKALCNKIIHDLMNIILTSCKEDEYKTVSQELIIAALRCLELIGGLNAKKTYVNGENKDNEQIRNFFISQGKQPA